MNVKQCCYCGFVTISFKAPLLRVQALYSTHLDAFFSLYVSIKMQLKSYRFLGPSLTVTSFELNSNDPRHGLVTGLSGLLMSSFSNKTVSSLRGVLHFLMFRKELSK